MPHRGHRTECSPEACEERVRVVPEPSGGLLAFISVIFNAAVVNLAFTGLHSQVSSDDDRCGHRPRTGGVITITTMADAARTAGDRLSRGARVAFWIAAFLGSVHAGWSAYWAFGGRLLLDTVGRWAVDLVERQPITAAVGLVVIAIAKLLAAWIPPLSETGRVPGRRFWRVIAWIGGPLLVAYGAVNSVTAIAMLSGWWGAGTDVVEEVIGSLTVTRGCAIASEIGGVSAPSELHRRLADRARELRALAREDAASLSFETCRPCGRS